jgi:3-oxoacyl-[acyl-carrier protein] reductase
MKNLQGKVALITGSARGIGKKIAERMGSLGANIVINYSRDKAGAEETAQFIETLGVKVLAVQADISKVDDIARLFDIGKSTFGKIDIVVVNAGVEIIDLPMIEVTEQQYDHVYNVNTKGAFFTMQYAAKNVSDNGRIIYIGSTTTDYPMPGIGLYGSSKLPAKYLVAILAIELGKRGVTVNGIIPTAIDGAGVFTDSEANHAMRAFVENNVPMGRMGNAGDIANVAEFFASDLSSFVSGQNLSVTGGAKA